VLRITSTSEMAGDISGGVDVRAAPIKRSLRLGGVIAVALSLSAVTVVGQVAAPALPAAPGPTQVSTASDVATILWVDDIDVTRPIFLQVVATVRDALSARVPRRTLLRVESLGLHYPASAGRLQRLVARIADEYAREPVDLLVATGDSSVAVAMRLRAQWRRDIPIVGLFTGTERVHAETPPPSLPNGVQVRLGDLNRATARNILALIPTVAEVLIIGASTNDVFGAAEVMRPIFGAGVQVEGLVAPSHEDLAPRLERLGTHAAIVYLSVGLDSRGRTWQVREYLRRLLEMSPRPVFGWLASYVGLGIIGGPVLDGSEIGDELGRLSSEVLNGADPSTMAPVVIDETRLIYDWAPMRRFGIPLARLPAGAMVVNRPLPVWESYPRTSIAVTAFIVVLLAILLILVRSRRRTRKTNAAQLAMSRRLLQAQDEERVRIARDLHDDLCQQMAMLAMDISGSQGAALGPTVICDRVYELIDRTRSIAVDLHATHIGSMPFRDALAAHALSVQARTGLDLQVHVTSWHTDPAPNAALALFRCVQESLHNVIRHAEATQITISMESTDRTVRIEVTDDGIGFEPAAPGRVGLGLTSMLERMATIGGAFSVRSVPFGGTTVVLSAPFPGATS